MSLSSYDAWPALTYSEFKSTAHLLHMAAQAIGKLKLHTPFEPHWANVGLGLTSRGLTSGLISYKTGMFSIDVDLIDHRIVITTSWAEVKQFPLDTMSVATLTATLFSLLKDLQIDLSINMLPQEIPAPIAFDQDTTEQVYDRHLANAWWRILLSSYRMMQKYHARFNGESPPICLMWGTFDLRDARFNGKLVKPTGINSDYIRRNAMNEEQIEMGWWHGNEMYPRPAYYAFVYPQPEKIEQASLQPDAARWDNTLGEFILDYDHIRTSASPEKDLWDFFESTYQAGAHYAKWDPALIMPGEPI